MHCERLTMANSVLFRAFTILPAFFKYKSWNFITFCTEKLLLPSFLIIVNFHYQKLSGILEIVVVIKKLSGQNTDLLYIRDDAEMNQTRMAISWKPGKNYSRYRLGFTSNGTMNSWRVLTPLNVLYQCPHPFRWPFLSVTTYSDSQKHESSIY